MLDLRLKSVCAVEMTLDMFTGHVKIRNRNDDHA